MNEVRVETIDVVLPLSTSEDEKVWEKSAAKVLKYAPEKIGGIRLKKHSIDARKKKIVVRLRLEVFLGKELPPLAPITADYPPLPHNAPEVVVIGTGPAGLFAALRLIECGVKPILLERGKDASSRRFDLAPILRQGTVIEDSNYCFGEGGAGTFSDGKLYTRATKRGPVAKIYETFVAHGAPDRILVDAHPHIGSNLLPKVVMALRNSVLEAGGEVHFQSKVTRLILENDEIKGVATASGDEYRGQSVILATGHSARDIYHLLQDHHVHLEAKPFAVGVRIEHPQQLIDAQQYHFPREQIRPNQLPAASYTLATKIRDRGVHSFCMCPGGFIVPAATANDEVVVNGMSLSRRDSPFANSGLVVTVEPEDAEAFAPTAGVLAGLAYQKDLEMKAKTAGGGGQTAPAQQVLDFLQQRNSRETLPTSYFPGVNPAPLHKLLSPAVVSRMQEGIKLFGNRLRGFAGAEAQLIGVETRTSSPVRIPRDRATCEHVQIRNLFPCGEGAGYAGGIVSAAMDGMKCAEAAAIKCGREIPENR